jgi:hypothetical protein
MKTNDIMGKESRLGYTKNGRIWLGDPANCALEDLGWTLRGCAASSSLFELACWMKTNDIMGMESRLGYTKNGRIWLGDPANCALEDLGWTLRGCAPSSSLFKLACWIKTKDISCK